MTHRSGFPSLHFLRMHIAIAAVCVLSVLLPGMLGAQEPNVAGLIVNYGDGRVSYAVVPFDEDEINGVELLQLSGLDVVTVGFGGLGDAVCQVDDTGCPVDDCRKRVCQTSDPESPFWQFSKLNGDAWQFVATGASGARIRDGDIYAWSWTGIEPDLPIVTMEELSSLAGGDPLSMEEPQAVLRTEGESGDEYEDGFGMTGIVAVGGVVAVAALLILRGARRPSGTSDER